MKKTSLQAILSGLVCAVLFTCTANADFVKTASYTDGQFSDVPSSEWYASSVKDAYEYGIMNGTASSLFSPNETLTVAEGITIAARIHQTLSGADAIPAADGEWYQMYVNYALSAGFLKEGQFDSYDRKIKRFEMAELFAGVCPELPPVNRIDRIPDVSADADYADKLLMLYRAGILTGNDDYGTFAPETNLTRSEISAMSVRIADSSKRVQKSFAVKDAAPRDYSDAYYIIDSFFPNSRKGLANGWNYDNRFDFTNLDGYDKTTIFDYSPVKFYAFNRDFDAESDGILRLELVFTGNSSDEGVYIEFQDEAQQAQFGMTPKNGVWTLYGTDEISSAVSIAVDSSATYAIVMDIDLDNHTMSAVVNNVLCGSVSIPDAAVSRLVLGTTKKGTGSILFKHARLSKNYPLNEHFLVTDGQTGQKPADGWQISGDFVLAKTMVYAGVDNYSIKAQSAAGTVSSAKKLFTPVDGKVVFETFILLPQKTDGASVSLLSNGNPALTLETKNGSICIGDTVLHDYAANVWQCLRIEADTAAGKADIKIDGKTRATLDFDAAFFDGVTVAFAPQSDAVMWFDDVLLYRETEHGDYPSYPQVAASDGYNIGLNVCPLWHDNIASEGWDAVSPFPEFETYLGYYDEGTKEAMDWELKLMAEHGIDFMHVCWYALNNVTEPIKNNHRSYTYLHDAYMNAEYSDLVDFCLMWENGGKNVTSLEQFKTYIWSYWLEYYFSDPRYARLDNKAVLSVWSYDNFLSSFGGEAGAKAAVEFMNEDLKRLGYDGIILLTSVQSAVSTSTYTARANAGFDASYAYHWGENGYSAAHQISGNSQNLANSAGILHHIPTVSMGFNDVGRNESRSPIITGEDHLKVCESIKEMLDGMNTGTWKDNTLFVSTWNEFSEGTYVLPTASNGFDYLENLRAVFTNDTSDHSVTDAPLTETQLTRITRMYPDHHSPLRWFETEESDIGSDLDTLPLVAVRSYDMATTAGTDAWEHQFNIDNYSESGGVISGSSTSTDFAIKTSASFQPFSAEAAPIFHVRMKNSVAGAVMQIFFITDKDSTWNNDKRPEVKITSAGEFVDYYCDMSQNVLWSGTVTGIRFDPMTAVGSFEISLIEFMAPDTSAIEEAPVIKVNMNELSFTFKPVATADGDFEVVGEQRGKGFYSQLRVYYEWDRFTDDGVLTLKTRDEKTLVFKVGSDKVTVDGKEQSLGYTFTLPDGLPVFRIKKLANLLGYKYTQEGNTLNIQAATDEEYALLSESVDHPYSWNFDLGETDGWTLQNASIYAISDGRIGIIGTNADPAIIHATEFKATDFNTVTVGIKVNDTMREEGVESPLLFFRTQNDSGFTKEKKIVGAYDFDNISEDGIVEVSFYLPDNSLYTGLITALRFDPYNRANAFEIDYIRCENRAKVYSAEEKAILEALMSDAGYQLDKNYCYEFDDPSKLSEWVLHQVTGEIADGFIKLNATTTDPFFTHAASFNCEDYRRVVVGIKYNATMSQAGVEAPLFFFITEQDPTWSASKRFVGTRVIPENVREGDVIRIVFDLTENNLFTGKISQFRFDPYNQPVAYEVDYIRFYK